MRAAWIALVVGVLVAVGIVLAVATPTDDGLGPVARALALERGPALDARREAAVEAATRRCLQARGVADVPDPEPPPAIPDAELDPIAWAERWGFGITTSVGWSAPRTVPRTGVTPEHRIVVACRNAAATAVFGLRDRLLAPLRPALVALGAAIDADPATRDADARWVTCAASAVRREIPDLPPPSAPGRLTMLRTWFAAQAATTPAPVIAALERRVATAIARCDLVHADARRRAAEPHERAFVRQHAVELARIGAAIRDAEAADPTARP